MRMPIFLNFAIPYLSFLQICETAKSSLSKRGIQTRISQTRLRFWDYCLYCLNLSHYHSLCSAWVRKKENERGGQEKNDRRKLKAFIFYSDSHILLRRTKEEKPSVLFPQRAEDLELLRSSNNFLLVNYAPISDPVERAKYWKEISEKKDILISAIHYKSMTEHTRIFARRIWTFHIRKFRRQYV